jgi:hypothetical protein
VLPTDAPRPGAKVSLDIPGAVSLTGGVLALAYGVTEATGLGFASMKVLIALALSAALLIAFVVVEKSSSQPLLPGRMLRLRSVVAGNAVAALVSVVMIGAVFFNSLYLQEILGYSPIQAGLAWLPQTVLIMVVSNIGARIATKLGVRTLIALGTLVLGAGMLADAEHIAMASVARVDVLVSWNFRHIVNLPRIHGYHAVNVRLGYPAIEIRSPREVLGDG